MLIVVIESTGRCRCIKSNININNTPLFPEHREMLLYFFSSFLLMTPHPHSTPSEKHYACARLCLCVGACLCVPIYAIYSAMCIHRYVCVYMCFICASFYKYNEHQSLFHILLHTHAQELYTYKQPQENIDSIYLHTQA